MRPNCDFARCRRAGLSMEFKFRVDLFGSPAVHLQREEGERLLIDWMDGWSVDHAGKAAHSRQSASSSDFSCRCRSIDFNTVECSAVQYAPHPRLSSSLSVSRLVGRCGALFSLRIVCLSLCLRLCAAAILLRIRLLRLPRLGCHASIFARFQLCSPDSTGLSAAPAPAAAPSIHPFSSDTAIHPCVSA